MRVGSELRSLCATALVALIAACAQEDSGGGAREGAEEFAGVRLAEPEAVYPQGFSAAFTVRELDDGTVLVADPIGQALVRVDFATASADTVGGYGEGPSEYRQPDAVWPLPDGGTLLVDLGNGRLTELDAELEFGRTHPYSQGDPEDTTLMVVIPQGVDDRGRVYFSGVPVEENDSLPVLRLDLGTGELDTIARYRLPATRRDTITDARGRQRQRVSMVPLSPTDAWGVGADGRVALARAAGAPMSNAPTELGYFLEWIDEDGTSTPGPTVPYEPVPIGEAEKEEWTDRRDELGGGLRLEAATGDSAAAVIGKRGGPRPVNEDLDRYAWPEVLPAFYPDRVAVDPLGRAWVRRYAEAGAVTRYDVFSATGERAETVELGVGRRVVGFGEGSLYAIQMDDLGRQRLERYAIPM
ncbi:MAG: hypothetical protein OXG58_00865 [Gemmatimonadetes bacterium]|nr:hypothetical protein [Gemmatimonadota bacterium]